MTMTAPPATATATAGVPVLACDGLRKRFGDLQAVDGVAFTVAAGESYGLLGPNGAGKTTTISMLCGLLEPDDGEVRVGGERLTAGTPAVRSAIGYVPQEIALYPTLTARENLEFFGRLYGLRRAALDVRVDAGLELAGLTDRARDRVDTYSGGMKRRLNIAAGLLHEPALLILDEPTVGVDPQSRSVILDTVAALNGEGLAVIYTSHYMEEVERLCDRVGIIDEGRVVAEGTRRELIEALGEHDRIELTTDGDAESLARAVADVEGVTDARPVEGVVQLLAGGGAYRLPALLAAADRVGVVVTSVRVVEPDLEAVFLHLTGKALRDR
jgi:ABC-2 type transport system ATP-binding protein